MKVIKPAGRDLRLDPDIRGRTLLLGITSFLSQISLVAAMAAINNMIRRYGAMDAIFGQPQYALIPMAVVGIVMKFFQIVISIVVGMAAGCLTVFIHASTEFRAERIVSVYGEREAAPEVRIRDKDRRRAAYHRFYTDMKWGYAKNYQVSLDSGSLGIERCVEILKMLY